MTGSQTDYRIRFERGEAGLRATAADASIIVIVDVLSFSTAVDVAVSRGASVKAVRPNDDTALAGQLGAIRAVSRKARSISEPYSLSPDSLVGLPAGARLILPSPNGATLIACAEQFGKATVIAGCLRNASAIGAYINTRSFDGIVAVLAAGEHWPDGSLRPALEDDLGAGAILACLDLRDASPEARIVAQMYLDGRSDVAEYIRSSSSSRELSGIGFGHDVERALEIDISRATPILAADGFLSNEPVR
jgi:2-phosphosulfolactate phosphatase